MRDQAKVVNGHLRVSSNWFADGCVSYLRQEETDWWFEKRSNYILENKRLRYRKQKVESWCINSWRKVGKFRSSEIENCPLSLLSSMFAVLFNDLPFLANCYDWDDHKRIMFLKTVISTFFSKRIRFITVTTKISQFSLRKISDRLQTVL